MLKVNESKSAIMDTTNPLFIQSFIFTKKVLSDEGIKYFTKIFDELRELASLTAPFTSKEFKSIISRIYDIGNELKTNQHLHINKLDKFDKYYSSYIQRHNSVVSMPTYMDVNILDLIHHHKLLFVLLTLNL